MLTSNLTILIRSFKSTSKLGASFALFKVGLINCNPLMYSLGAVLDNFYCVFDVSVFWFLAVDNNPAVYYAIIVCRWILDQICFDFYANCLVLVFLKLTQWNCHGGILLWWLWLLLYGTKIGLRGMLRNVGRGHFGEHFCWLLGCLKRYCMNSWRLCFGLFGVWLRHDLYLVDV